MTEEDPPVSSAEKWVQVLSASTILVSTFLYFTFSYGVRGQIQFLDSAISQIIEKLGLN